MKPILGPCARGYLEGVRQKIPAGRIAEVEGIAGPVFRGDAAGHLGAVRAPTAGSFS
ncbi:MAG: hypothetical protein CM15mP84_05840 [Cellvibrionales bacterium]|nr:MAG: hypothetical protein CM15mP84_05840 [Cellvibrionales bacterium]